MSSDTSEPPQRRPGVDPAVGELEARLGCALRDPALALAALTHKSFVNEHRGEALTDNERLEFLGDAVIDLAVSHRLMERFPEAREGDLSKIRASLVDEAGLARVARALDLGPLLRLGRGEELTGGREKASLLADAMEAVIAAVYLTGGLELVLRVVDRFLGEAFARAAAGTLDRDYKTQVQELAQSRLRATPRYRVVAEHGPDHSKTFEVELELRGEVIGRGAGRSKKDAEQGAARCALEVINGRYGVEPRPLPVPAEPSEPESLELFPAPAPAEPEVAEAPPAEAQRAPEPAIEVEPETEPAPPVLEPDVAPEPVEARRAETKKRAGSTAKRRSTPARRPASPPARKAAKEHPARKGR